MDWRAVLISALYVLAVLALAEWARRRGVAAATTRKIVHVGIGTWIVPTYLLFEHKWWAAAPAFGFVVINAISFRFRLIRSMEGERRNVGTILYPLSIAALLLWSFGTARAPYAAAGVLAMTYGDAAASLVGRRFGRRHYRVGPQRRTLEGSLTMAVVSYLAILGALLWMGVELDTAHLGAALLTALVATLLEAVSLYGFDNLLVPVGTALTLTWLLSGSS
jgi:dolichol kinase